MVASLRRFLIHSFEAAEEAAERPRRAYEFARFLVRARHELAHASQALRDADDPERERVMRQAEIAYFTYPERFARIQGRADMLKEWTKLLLEATEKVAIENSQHEAYAVVADENRNERADSPVAVASRRSVQRWR